MIKDLAAVRAGNARANGIDMEGDTVTPGFRRILQPGEMISVMIRLEDGQTAHGDCMDVIFSGAAGRDPVFRAAVHLPIIEGEIRSRLVGREIDAFRPFAEEIDALEVEGKGLHTAVRYGMTQALLHAAALARHETMAETVARDYGTEIATEAIPILGMCPTDQPFQAEKMMLKGVEVLPHANFVTAGDLGVDGAAILEYTSWLSRRIGELGGEGYHPAIHLDVYGGIGAMCEMDAGRMSEFIVRLAERSAPYELLVETPVVAETRQAQIETFSQLKANLAEAGCGAKLVADEWCNTLDDAKAFADAAAVDYIQVKMPDLGGLNNTIEALLYCRQSGIGAYCGGSANETDQSARISSHIALACRADVLMNKPGQGVDEGLVILRNEMSRTLAMIRGRTG
jgi:methylaspartate ammonia-lyase